MSISAAIDAEHQKGGIVFELIPIDARSDWPIAGRGDVFQSGLLRVRGRAPRHLLSFILALPAFNVAAFRNILRETISELFISSETSLMSGRVCDFRDSEDERQLETGRQPSATRRLFSRVQLVPPLGFHLIFRYLIHKHK